jgi:GT2 family glycosyltransferase
VVVATRDRPDMLRTALEAVVASLRPGDELVVVDSASEDRRVGAVASEAGARVVRCDVPGTCRARNVGMRVAISDVIAFTDDDCLPETGWVTALAGVFARQPAIGFVTGRVLAQTEARARRLTVSVADEDVPRIFSSSDTAGDIAAVGHGANMAWRRAALEGVGGFDEAMGPGAPLRAAEDHDAFWRALQAGFTGCFEPAAVVRHRQWRTSRGQLAAFFAYGVGRGGLFVKQWRLGSGPGEARLAALIRLPAGRAALRELLWDRGVAAVGKRVAEGYELGALAEATALAGALRGAWRARRLALVHGHFQVDHPPSRHAHRRGR